METLKCPVCEKKGLIKSSRIEVPENRIICANEYFIHFKVGTVEFLTNIEAALIEKERLEAVLN